MKLNTITIEQLGKTISLPFEENRSAYVLCICGQNRTGKSFFLRSIFYSLISKTPPKDRKLAISHYKIRSVLRLSEGVAALAPEPYENVLFRPFWQDLDEYDEILLKHCMRSLRKAERLAGVALVYNIVRAQVGESDISSDTDGKAADSRPRLAEYFQANQAKFRENATYFASVGHPVIDELEKFLGGRVGVQFIREGFRLFLEEPKTKSKIFYPDWNIGSQVYLNAIVKAGLLQYSIMLIDEIENHLHPQLATRLIATLRKFSSLIVVVTHDPHVMSSVYVDQVVFFRGPKVLELNRAYDRKEILRPPTRLRKLPLKKATAETVAVVLPEHLESISSGIQRLEAIRTLFEASDSELLTSSALINSAAALDLTKSLFDSQFCRALESKEKVTTDGQTSILGKYLIEHFRGSRELTLLDVGAGKARQYYELAKMAGQGGLRYFCWDPYENPTVSTSGENHSLFWADRSSYRGPFFDSSGNKVEQQKFSVILLSNVIHRLWPDQLADYLSNFLNMIEVDGKIVLAEICPLGHPERMAFEYTQEDLGSLLLGARSLQVSPPVTQNYGNQHQLVLLGLSKRANTTAQWEPNAIRAEVLQSIEAAWRDRYNKLIRMHESEAKVVGLQEVSSALRATFTICRIREYFDVRCAQR